jgi:hypothetical protein
MAATTRVRTMLMMSNSLKTSRSSLQPHRVTLLQGVEAGV